MNDKDIRALIFLTKSCTNNKNKKYKGIFDEIVENTCKEFCNKHNINITHGSAYKEIKHKNYYYINKYIMHFIAEREDLYEFRKYNVLTDKEIVDRVLNRGK